MPPPERDSDESDWNENLYLHQYHAKVQSQVPPRHPPPGWGNWRNKECLPKIPTTESNVTPMEDNNNNRDNKNCKVKVYYVLPEDIPKDIVVENPKTISQEEFDKCKIVKLKLFL